MIASVATPEIWKKKKKKKQQPGTQEWALLS
jgi:hypothetical protein